MGAAAQTATRDLELFRLGYASLEAVAPVREP